MSAQARVEWFGRLRVDQPVKPTHQLLSHHRGTIWTHACTSCSWTVETYALPGTEQYFASQEKVRDAFARHLLITAAESADPLACTCYWVDPKYWFTHYGAVEPGSTMEPNPDCLVHFPPEAAP